MPQHTGGAINRLEKQVVTMVSEDNAQIAVSDDESKATTSGNHTFKGTYQNDNLPQAHLIDSIGSSFEPVAQPTAILPFRCYLMSNGQEAAPRRIYISGNNDEEPIEETTERKLTIYSKNKTIHIESTLEKEAVGTIYDLSGQLIKRLTIQPMTKKIIPVSSRGIYIVNKQKVAVP